MRKVFFLLFFLSVSLQASGGDPDSLCTRLGQTVSVEGILHFTDSIICLSDGLKEFCLVQLVDPYSDTFLPAGLDASRRRALEKPNEMALIDGPMEMPGFRAMTSNGIVVGEGALVRMTGTIRSPIAPAVSARERPCALLEVGKLEAIDRLNSTGRVAARSTLHEAVAKGWVNASVEGRGLNSISVKITPQIDFDLELSIEPGTLFLASSAGVQNMVVRRSALLVLKPALDVSLDLDVSCANMDLKQPGPDDRFTVSKELATADLTRLLRLPEFRFQTLRTQQFAVWTITDNPERAAILGIRTSEEQGSGPSAREMERIGLLFDRAGIEKVKYNLFRTSK